MRDNPRPRRPVSSTSLRLLRPLYRYSTARDAYVLRIAGGRYGPALTERAAATDAELTPLAAVPGEEHGQPTGRFLRPPGRSGVVEPLDAGSTTDGR